jgi:hypothetical protein
LEAHAAAPTQAELLAQGLGDSDLSLAGHRAGGGSVHDCSAGCITW